MATAPVTGSTSSPDGGVYADADKGSGWLLFAGIMIVLAGILNVIYGIAAIGNAHFFVANQKYILTGLNTWAWAAPTAAGSASASRRSTPSPLRPSGGAAAYAARKTFVPHVTAGLGPC